VVPWSRGLVVFSPRTLTARLEIKNPSVNQPLAHLYACFSPPRCAHIQYVYIYHTVTLPCAALGKRWLVGRSQSVPGRLTGRIGNHLTPLPLARSTARDGWDGLNRTSGPVVPPALRRLARRRVVRGPCLRLDVACCSCSCTLLRGPWSRGLVVFSPGTLPARFRHACPPQKHR
jgi:hypothetical protein